jgi:hypothetical protein
VKTRIANLLKRFINPPRRQERGQSMVEMALAFPVLLLVLAGTLEIGMYYNHYLTLVDATREAARFSADNDYLAADDIGGCLPNADPRLVTSDTKDFYNVASCMVLRNMFGMAFDPAIDDIIVSVVKVKDGAILARYPPDDPALTTPSTHHATLGNDRQHGWSYCLNVIKTGCTPAASYFSDQAILDRLSAVSAAPDTGLVLVEVYHRNRQFLGLIPPGLAFMPDSVMMYAYTLMPLPSAAPPPE